MTSNKSVFLNDVPVTKKADNKLWSPGSSVMQEVNEVANAILTEDGKLTFAVYGAWGAGKTSFLRLVQNSVEEQMQAQEVVFCWYEASNYQGAGAPETTIALRIWNTLGGEESSKNRYAAEAYNTLADYMRGILADEFVDSEEKGRVKPYQLLQVLARKTA
jgi:Cdc6-like AAA superfamily ATPase